jgi:hypothetical protein
MLICLAVGTKVYVCSFVIMIFLASECVHPVTVSRIIRPVMCCTCVFVPHALVILLHNCTSCFGCCTALQRVRHSNMFYRFVPVSGQFLVLSSDLLHQLQSEL